MAETVNHKAPFNPKTEFLSCITNFVIPMAGKKLFQYYLLPQVPRNLLPHKLVSKTVDYSIKQNHTLLLATEWSVEEIENIFSYIIDLHKQWYQTPCGKKQILHRDVVSFVDDKSIHTHRLFFEDPLMALFQIIICNNENHVKYLYESFDSLTTPISVTVKSTNFVQSFFPIGKNKIFSS